MATDDLRVLAGELSAISPEMTRKVSGALTRHVNAIAATAADLAPRDRPWLATQGIRKDTRTLGRRVYVPEDPDGVPVGVYVEFGTSKMAPQPFLLPAFERHAPAFYDDVRSIVDELVRDAGS